MVEGWNFKTLFPYLDKTRDVRSNIPLCRKEFLRAKSEGTPEGKKVYLTVHPDSSPHTEEFKVNIQLLRMIYLILQQIKVPSSRGCCKALPNLQHAFSLKCPSSRRRLGRAFIPLPLDGALKLVYVTIANLVIKDYSVAGHCIGLKGELTSKNVSFPTG